MKKMYSNVIAGEIRIKLPNPHPVGTANENYYISILAAIDLLPPFSQKINHHSLGQQAVEGVEQAVEPAGDVDGAPAQGLVEGCADDEVGVEGGELAPNALGRRAVSGAGGGGHARRAEGHHVGKVAGLFAQGAGEVEQEALRRGVDGLIRNGKEGCQAADVDEQEAAGGIAQGQHGVGGIHGGDDVEVEDGEDFHARALGKRAEIFDPGDVDQALKAQAFLLQRAVKGQARGGVGQVAGAVAHGHAQLGHPFGGLGVQVGEEEGIAAASAFAGKSTAHAARSAGD